MKIGGALREIAPGARYNRFMIRLRTLLDSWSKIRHDTAQAVSEFPESAFDETLVGDCMSFRATATHILEVGHGYAGALLAGVDNFAVPNFGEVVGEYRMPLPDSPSAADLSEALLESVRERIAEFEEQPGAFWTEEITRHDGERVTRMEAVQFLKEHELTHRSQLFMYLRLKGIVPVTTRRREAARRQQA